MLRERCGVFSKYTLMSSRGPQPQPTWSEESSVGVFVPKGDMAERLVIVKGI